MLPTRLEMHELARQRVRQSFADSSEQISAAAYAREDSSSAQEPRSLQGWQEQAVPASGLPRETKSWLAEIELMKRELEEVSVTVSK